MAFGIGFIQDGETAFLETAQGFGTGADGFDQRNLDAGGLEGTVGFGANAPGDDRFGSKFGDGFGGLDASALGGVEIMRVIVGRGPAGFGVGQDEIFGASEVHVDGIGQRLGGRGDNDFHVDSSFWGGYSTKRPRPLP